MSTLKEKVCTVVVSYNRPQKLGDCIQALCESKKKTEALHTIIIVDNGSDQDPRPLLTEKGWYQSSGPRQPFQKLVCGISLAQESQVAIAGVNIAFFTTNFNSGGAGGFAAGLELAFTMPTGFTHFWLMDDDAQAEPDCLPALLEAARSGGFQAVCPLIIGAENHVQIYHHKAMPNAASFSPVPQLRAVARTTETKHLNTPISMDANAFVGPLFSREVVAATGIPLPDFFIHGDDTEYTYRVSKAFGLRLIPQARINHQDGNYHFQKAFPAAQAWKVYYSIRNRIWIARLHYPATQLIMLCFRVLAGFLKPGEGIRLKWNRLIGLLHGLTGLIKIKRAYTKCSKVFQ